MRQVHGTSIMDLVAPRLTCVLLIFASSVTSGVHSSLAPVTSHRRHHATVQLGHDYYIGRTLTISTILIEPYAMVKCVNSSAYRGPNDLYEGFMVDVISQLAQIAGFRYRLVPAADSKFGFQEKNGSWNGMIGELLRGEVDVAAANMYVTRRRKNVVDFTESFRTVGASVLMSKHHSTSPLTLSQLVDAYPDIVFGTLNRGLIYKALRKTNDSTLKRVFSSMRENSDRSFTRTNEEGINRVRTWKNPLYAYILPDVIGEYMVHRKPCDLVVAERILTRDEFALAVPPGSALQPMFNKALTIMKDEGKLEELYRKWWWQRDECAESNRLLTLRGGLPAPQAYNSGADREVRLSIPAFLTMVMYQLLPALR